jgi:hypothetical protein
MRKDLQYIFLLGGTAKEVLILSTVNSFPLFAFQKLHIDKDYHPKQHLLHFKMAWELMTWHQSARLEFVLLISCCAIDDRKPAGRNYGAAWVSAGGNSAI